MSRSYDLMHAARRWLTMGVSVVPVEPMLKACVIRWREYEHRQPSLSELRRWFQGGTSNLAAVCGTGGLIVLDFDDLKHYASFIYRSGELGKTYTEFTGRGAHLFYQVDEPKTARFIECESLGLGHLCMVAPSIHPSGSIYRPALNPCNQVNQVSTGELFSLLSPTEKRNQEPMAGTTRPTIPGSTITGTGLVKDIKAAFNLLEYAQSITRMKPSGADGRWWLGRCPLHDDRSPSMWVDAQRQVWGCHSPSCPGHRAGDVINLYALVNHMAVGDAIRALARTVNL